MMNKKQIGKYLQKLRISKGLNRTQAAAQIRTSYKSINDWESGTMPSNENLIKLSKFYNVSIDDILECGHIISNEDLYNKYPNFRKIDFSKPVEIDNKKDYYTPYQNQIVNVNVNFKKLLLAYRNRVLSRSEDHEFRFLFENMCSFSTYYLENYDNNLKDKYISFLLLLNTLIKNTNSSNEYYFEVMKCIEKGQYDSRFQYPEFGIAEKDKPKDGQFKILEPWQKDMFLALIQNSDCIFDPSQHEFHLRDYEQKYGVKFDKEKVVKNIIKYFIENGAEINPWLLTNIEIRKEKFDILDSLEKYYLDYVKPLFIHYINEDPSSEDEYSHCYVENNGYNRFLDDYYSKTILFHSLDGVTTHDIFNLYTKASEEEIVNFIYKKRYKNNKEECEYRFKKANILNDLSMFYEMKQKLEMDLDTNKIFSEIEDLENKLSQGQRDYYKYTKYDISEDKGFDHWDLMKYWISGISYNRLMKKRNHNLTQELYENLDSLSLEQIREKYFPKEEVSETDE